MESVVQGKVDEYLFVMRLSHTNMFYGSVLYLPVDVIVQNVQTIRQG